MTYLTPFYVRLIKHQVPVGGITVFSPSEALFHGVAITAERTNRITPI